MRKLSFHVLFTLSKHQVENKQQWKLEATVFEKKMPPRGVQEAPKNFSWLIVNEIAGCAMINSEFELLWLKNIGIKHILCLNKDLKASHIFEENDNQNINVEIILEFQGAK